jgi:LacI family transcriptional regulator
MDYLIGLGHTRIAFIQGRPEISSAVRREQGYRDSLIKAGIEPDPALNVPGDFTTETGYARALDLLRLERRPTAIFAANDQSALGVYRAADELGLRIPDDVSLVGFDNIYETRFLGLTTVDQNLMEMGRAAVEMLIKLVNDERVEVKTYKIPTRLIVRDSCRSPR